MPRRLTVLWIALAFLLSLAAVDSCDDCLRGDRADCCPPACCPCCAHSPSALTAAIEPGPSPVDIGAAGEPAADRSRSSDPRDVFHVPKSPLA